MDAARADGDAGPAVDGAAPTGGGEGPPARLDPGIEQFNALPAEDSRAALHACCAAPQWIEDVVRGRPYPSRDALTMRSRQALAELDWKGIRQALEAHPRIGQRLASTSREAVWSATEQSGVDAADARTRAALDEANRAYERRFGHAFLIFATGKTDVELLAAARERVNHDVSDERLTVRAELEKIVILRILNLLNL
jgi:2-oxo-4-hydroxy-4-carboxy-5-ureidoimidazoline decarboxylase